jgi:hypothetical protein
VSFRGSTDVAQMVKLTSLCPSRQASNSGDHRAGAYDGKWDGTKAPRFECTGSRRGRPPTDSIAAEHRTTTWAWPAVYGANRSSRRLNIAGRSSPRLSDTALVREQDDLPAYD